MRALLNCNQYKFALKNSWYFDYFNKKDALLGLCTGLMGVRATHETAAFFVELTNLIVNGHFMKTDGGFYQTRFNILLFQKGLRFNESTQEGAVNVMVHNRSLRLRVSVVCEETFRSPCQSMHEATRIPLFAHANCVGASGVNPTYAEHVTAKKRWMNETGFWFDACSQKSIRFPCRFHIGQRRWPLPRCCA